MLGEHNRWIISRYYFKEFKSLDVALETLADLKAAEPDQVFAMYRIKRAGHEPGCPRNRKLGIKCECPQGLYEAPQAAVTQPMGDYDDMIENVAMEMAGS